MAALDILIVANTSSPHYFGGPLRAVSLNRLYFSHLRSDQLETCCITFRGIKKIYFKPKNVANSIIRRFHFSDLLT